MKKKNVKLFAQRLAAMTMVLLMCISMFPDGTFANEELPASEQTQSETDLDQNEDEALIVSGEEEEPELEIFEGEGDLPSSEYMIGGSNEEETSDTLSKDESAGETLAEEETGATDSSAEDPAIDDPSTEESSAEESSVEETTEEASEEESTEEEEDPESEPVDEEETGVPLEHKVLTQTAGEMEVVVEGNLPVDAELAVIAIPMDKGQLLVDALGEQDAAYENLSGAFVLDISIISGGNQYQPVDFGESVQVHVRGLDASAIDMLDRGATMSVIHVKDDMLQELVTFEEETEPVPEADASEDSEEAAPEEYIAELAQKTEAVMEQVEALDEEAILDATETVIQNVEDNAVEIENLTSTTVEEEVAFKMESFSIVVGVLAPKRTSGITFGGPSKDTAGHSGTRLYNAQRWNEQVDKFWWADTSGITKANGGTVTPWSGASTAPTETVSESYTMTTIGAGPALAEGVGTYSATFYKVYTAEQLRYCIINGWNIKLMNDIDLGGHQGQNWGSITNKAKIVNGNGHTIYNLYSSGAWRLGLMGLQETTGFQMFNLRLSNVYIYASNGNHTRSAALIGDFRVGAVDQCVVENVYVSASQGGGTHVGGVFAPCNDSTSGVITCTYVTARNINVYGNSCVSDFMEGPWGGTGGDIRVVNCALVDSVDISNGGHSGGFTSCQVSSGSYVDYYKNCYTNVDVYGNTETGVFVGVTHSGNHYFENCFAAGKIEGTSSIGGFFGNNSGGASIKFINCYSTSMVGMANGGSNMGGFAGQGNTGTFTNCYAAGEVGTLNSNEDGTPVGASNVRGFSGNNAGSCTNCYYDKQTTACRGQGSELAGVTGLLTKDLIALNLGSAWVTSAAGYPQLKVFAQGDSRAKAYSAASVATVLLFPSDGETSQTTYNQVKAQPETALAYDTVRRIKYVFPLTNNTNNGSSGNSYLWEIYYGEDPSNPIYTNISPLVAGGTTKIITLAEAGTNDNVSALAPGVGWLQANATNGGVTGMRRLRLVPTTAITLAATNAVIGSDTTIYSYHDPKIEGSNLDGANNAPEELYLKNAGTTSPSAYYYRYDHTNGINFITATAKQMYTFLNQNQSIALATRLSNSGISSKNFQSTTPSFSADRKVMTYTMADMNNDTVEVKVSFKGPNDTSYTEQTWTDSLVQLMTQQRDATAADAGTYLLSYEWKNSSGALTAQGSKYLRVLEPAYIYYYWNYPNAAAQAERVTPYRAPRRAPASGGADSVYAVDPGEYLLYGKVADNDRDVATAPTLKNYSFVAWSTRSDALGTSTNSTAYQFTKNTSIANEGKNNIYAIWSLNAPGASLTKTMVNVTHEGDADYEGNQDEYLSTAQVGDVLKYTIKAGNNRDNSSWKNIVLTDALPAGVELLTGSEYPITLTKTDSSGELGSWDASSCYNASTNTFTVNTKSLDDTTVGDGNDRGALYGKSSYEFTFFVKVTDDANPKSDPDHKTFKVIKNTASAKGEDVEGNPVNIDGASNETNVYWNDPTMVTTKSAKNVTTGKTAAQKAIYQVGDTVEYTVEYYTSSDQSAWNNVVLTDEIPDGLDWIDVSTVKVYRIAGGSTTDVTSSVNKSFAGGTLSVGPVNVVDTDKYRVTFQVKVNADVPYIYRSVARYDEHGRLYYPVTNGVEMNGTRVYEGDSTPATDTAFCTIPVYHATPSSGGSGGSGTDEPGGGSGGGGGTDDPDDTNGVVSVRKNVYEVNDEAFVRYDHYPMSSGYHYPTNGPINPTRARVNDVVTFQIRVKNDVKGAAWHNTVLKDVIPTGMEYVDGSAEVYWLRPTEAYVYDDEVGYRASSSDWIPVALTSEDEDGNTTSIVSLVNGELQINLGDIYYQEEYLIYVDCKITPDIGAEENLNEEYYCYSHGWLNRIFNTAVADGQDEAETVQVKAQSTTHLDVYFDHPDPHITKSSAVQRDDEDEPDTERIMLTDVITYTINVTNDRPGSLWRNIVIRDVIPEELILDTDSVLLYRIQADGSLKEIDYNADPDDVYSMSYDNSTRLLMITVGDIPGGEGYRVSFDVQIEQEEFLPKDNPDQHEEEFLGEISNKATASGQGALPGSDDDDDNDDPDNPDDEEKHLLPGDEDITVSDVDEREVDWTDPGGYITKTTTNRTRKDSKVVRVEDIINYKINVNNYVVGSMWKNIEIKDVIPEDLELVTDSLVLRGPYKLTDSGKVPDNASAKKIPASNYDESTRTLTVPVGNVQGGYGYEFSFDVIIAEEILEEVEIEETVPMKENYVWVGPPENYPPGPGTGGPGGPGWVGPSWIGHPGVGRFGPGDEVVYVSLPYPPLIGGGDWVYYPLPDPYDPEKWVFLPFPPGTGEPWTSEPPEVFPPEPEPWGEKEAVNRSRRTGNSCVGDRITYTLKLGNRRSRTVWENISFVDQLSVALDLDPDSIYLTWNGKRIQQDASKVWDEETRTLTVPVGDIYGGQTAVLVFDVRINELGLTEDIGNGFIVGPVEVPPVYPLSDIVDPEDPQPELDKEVENETRKDGSTQPQDILSYEIALSNPTAGSLWRRTIIFDYLPEGLELDSSSLYLEYPSGRIEHVNSSVYDEDTRMIQVPIGDLHGGETYTLRYKAKVVVEYEEVVEHPVEIMNVTNLSADGPNDDVTVPVTPPTGDANRTSLKRYTGLLRASLIGMAAVGLLMVLRRKQEKAED